MSKRNASSYYEWTECADRDVIDPRGSDRSRQLFRRDLPAVFRLDEGRPSSATRRPALKPPPVAGVPLGLYLHIPFCRKRCHFCYFRVYTDKNAQEVDDYLDVLAREWELYSQQPAIAGRPLNFVYFGGGTPSFLSTRQLEGLVRPPVTRSRRGTTPRRSRSSASRAR